MDFLSVAAGFVTAALSLFAVILALWAKFERRQERLIHRVLIEVGLIRYRRPADPPGEEWPNGWTNLPDALDGIHHELTAHIDAHNR